LTFLVTNRGIEAAELSLSLAGHPGGTSSMYRLSAERVTAGAVNEPVEMTELVDGVLLEIPGQSVTLYVVPDDR
jgi:hypothetical protein